MEFLAYLEKSTEPQSLDSAMMIAVAEAAMNLRMNKKDRLERLDALSCDCDIGTQEEIVEYLRELDYSDVTS